MKRIYVLLLAMLLLLTGCKGKGTTQNVSVTDVLCPYQFTHTKDALEITLHDGAKSGIVWQAEMIPADIGQLSQVETKKEYTTQYRVTGAVQGASQITFAAYQGQEVMFYLYVIVDVDASGKVTLSSYEHREIQLVSVEENGLKYKWNVDADGILNFSFTNSDDKWHMSGTDEDICTFVSQMATPVGYKFSAQALQAGQTTVQLIGENTQRTIQITLRVDEQGKMEVVSVQEQ